MSNTITDKEEQIREWLEAVKDPEVPALSVMDLGIVRSVQVDEREGQPLVTLVITPTYSGCPAMDVINMDIRLKLIEKGYRNVVIRQSLSPAWTTDWMSEAGKQKLKAFGIAPPQGRSTAGPLPLFSAENVPCPHCRSHHTELISGFSSTACKAMYRCLDCREAFDYFKCH